MSKKGPVRIVKAGNVAIPIYRIKSKSAKTGYQFRCTIVSPDGSELKTTRADLDELVKEVQPRANLMAQGDDRAAYIKPKDITELFEARKMIEPYKVHLLVAVQEWVTARDLAGTAILDACRTHKETRPMVERIRLNAAIDKFISAKEKSKREGERVYRSKLTRLSKFCGDVYLDTIGFEMLTNFRNSFEDGVSANDHLKRAGTLMNWAIKAQHLPRNYRPPTADVEKAPENPAQIGIISPETYADLLKWLHAKYPEYLAAAILAGHCGLRSDEIHGKRSKKGVPRETMPRQLWEDIDLDSGHLNVSVAKTNTPSWRLVELQPAAIKWLKLCFVDGHKPKGYVCAAGAMERVRQLAIGRPVDQGGPFALPENCFRHSWITYRIAKTGDKAKTASLAGNSVQEIDKRYRRPMAKAIGVKWFNTLPP